MYPNRAHAATLAALILAASPLAAQQRPASPGPRVEISFAKAAHAAPITGRVYVAFAKVPAVATTPTGGGRGGRGGNPIDQTGETGVPLFAMTGTFARSSSDLR